MKKHNQNHPLAVCKILVTTYRKNTSTLWCSALHYTSALSEHIHSYHFRVCLEAIQSPDFCFNAKTTQKSISSRSSMAKRYAPRAHCFISTAQPRWVPGMQCVSPAVRHGFSWHLVAARHADRAPAGSHQQPWNRLQNSGTSENQTPNCPQKGNDL